MKDIAHESVSFEESLLQFMALNKYLIKEDCCNLIKYKNENLELV